MLMDPAKIGFENVCDIVDYTARGCIPSKDDFRAVMAKVRQPDVGIRVDVKAPYIPSGIVPTSPESRELLAQVLERVDEDRRKNRRDRNIATAVLAVAGVGVGLLIGGHHHHDEAKVAEGIDGDVVGALTLYQYTDGSIGCGGSGNIVL